MTTLTIGIENSEGGCGWVKVNTNRLTRAHIEDLVDVLSEYEKHANDFLFGKSPFPIFSEFLQNISNISNRLEVDVQPDLNLEHFSDNDVQHIFCDFFKKNEGPIRVFIFVGKGDISDISVSSEGSVEQIEHVFRSVPLRPIRMTR
jgi:hypothetical protein